MDLRHLETFVRIAELKSFTKAAEMLYLTQPTVSKQIVDLERFFEVKLIDRTKRSVVLTKAGEILLKYAIEFMALKKETIDAIDAFRGLKKGTMLLGASTIPGTYMLPRLLGLFNRQYEGIQLRLLISDSKDVLNMTDLGEIDIGFVGAKDDTRKIDYKKIIDDTIVIAAPKDYPDTIPLASLKDYPLIAREPGSGTRNAFDLAMARFSSSQDGLKTVAELSSTQAIKEAVKGGMGLTYISRMAIGDELAHKELKVVRVEGLPEIRRSFYMVTKKGKTPLPQVKAFMDILEKWRKHEKS
ncbi:MAG TPA: selenium metabolism-associated LysR family transcriptional regulator [Syntrophorhabdaceae bacterium]|jgi:DNA-binding transcriptional LysR family regulator